MPAGLLRERIAIEQESNVSDGQGGSTLSWTNVCTIWARISPLRGMERLQSMQVQDETVRRITIRYRTDITPKMRAVWGSRIMNIREVINPDEHKKYLQLMVEDNVGV
jgi:SPP1 family predicted phage head-tail adaptor